MDILFLVSYNAKVRASETLTTEAEEFTQIAGSLKNVLNYKTYHYNYFV